MLVRLDIPALVVLMTLLCGGCASFDKPRTPKSIEMPTNNATKSTVEQARGPHKTENANAQWLFRYYRLASTASAATLSDEYETAKNEYEAEKTPSNQWRLAILLSIPGTSFHDTERSSALFKELTNEEYEKDSALNDTAYLMYSLIKQQNHAVTKSDELEKRLAEYQAANRKLKEQLDALKKIEETLYQRNKAEDIPQP